MTSMTLSLFIFSVLVAPVVGGEGGFRGRGIAEEFLELASGQLDSAEVRARLQELMDGIISGNNGEVKRVEQLISTTFQAMPKTSSGRIGPHAVRHVLHSHFLKQHGWSLFSLQSDLGQGNSSKDMMKLKVPGLLEAILEAREHGQGLTLAEVSSLATTVERLILDESVQILRWGYMMNGVQDGEEISERMAREVLVSYLLLFKRRNKNISAIRDPSGHLEWKDQKREDGDLRAEDTFVKDIMGNFKFSHAGALNPFGTAMYSFEMLAQMVDAMTQQFGRWKGNTCELLRSSLERAETVAGSGRVALADFYGIHKVSRFLLVEPEEDLRRIGVLDESVPGRATVRIANYITYPGNCEHFSEYFDACCFNACDVIVSDLENEFKAPSAEPERLLAVLANYSAVADAELQIPPSPLAGSAGEYLRQSLRSIAKRNGGMVPLQGRNFASWLHFAFPRDCPLPSKEQDEEVSVEAMKQVAPAEWAADMEYHMPAQSEWEEEDSVPVLQDLQHQTPPGSNVRVVMRWVAMIGAAIAVINIGLEQLKSMRSALGFEQSKKNDDFELPLRF